MAQEKKESLMLLSGAHPVHVQFAGSIDSETFRVPVRATKSQSAPLKALSLFQGALSVPTGYKYEVCESCYFYPAIKRKLGLLPNSKIINLSGGPILYYILSGRVKGFEARLLKDLLNSVDGHLVYAKFGEYILKQLNITKPIRKIYPFIKSGLYENLLKGKPSLDSHRLCIVATSDAYNKGLDILFRALNTVAEQFPDVKVEIVSRMDPSEISSMGSYDPARVILSSNVSDMEKVLSRSSLYIQPSRSETFSISALEAMAGGIPSLVSDQCGVKELVEKVDKRLVIPVDEKALSKSIIDYFGFSKSERLSLSKKSRETALPFNEKNMLKDFRDQFESLKKEI